MDFVELVCMHLDCAKPVPVISIESIARFKAAWEALHQGSRDCWVCEGTGRYWTYLTGYGENGLVTCHCPAGLAYEYTHTETLTAWGTPPPILYPDPTCDLSAPIPTMVIEAHTAGDADEAERQ